MVKNKENIKSFALIDIWAQNEMFDYFLNAVCTSSPNKVYSETKKTKKHLYFFLKFLFTASMDHKELTNMVANICRFCSGHLILSSVMPGPTTL